MVFPGPSTFDSDAAGNESFDTLYSAIVSIVYREYAATIIGPVDCDDIAQEVSVKVWLYSLTHPIYYPKALIRRTAHNLCIDLQRRLKPSLYQPFPEDEFGETGEDTFAWMDTLPEDDPEWCAINNEGVVETTGQVADAITGLSPCQQDAAVCTLKTRVGDWQRMAAALAARGINADLEWPADPADKRRLQASFSPARSNIARHIGEDLSVDKHR